MTTHHTIKRGSDVILIGAGIMSATLGMLLKELEPQLSVHIFERLDMAAAESSDSWNNAGTGHSALCELNYTPERKDGSIDITKAVKIAESFEISKQFWAYLIERKLISVPESFIRSLPHISFVWGEQNVAFLRKRYEALQQCHLFRPMRYSEAFDELLKWMPLVMKDRDHQQPLAATRTLLGTDVNFGTLTRCLFNRLKELDNVTLHFNHEVRSLHQDEHGYWHVKVKNTTTGEKKDAIATFVFIGAGGGSLPLMLKSGIPEGKGYGGFPVSGQWLRCTNPELIAQHNGKVYGKAAIGSPPMSVPHLDTRFIKGKKELLFGPYAGFSMKFLKKGSVLDLMKSVRITNIWPMLSAGFHNIPLTRYLIDQVRQSDEDRLEALRHFVPDAQMKDWTLEIAGQRVQVIKKDEEEGGILEFGTEVVSAEDGSLAALLGASPGASTAVSIMIGLLSKSFPSKMESEAWKNKLKEMIPSFGESLGEDPELCRKIREWSGRILNLKIPQPVE